MKRSFALIERNPHHRQPDGERARGRGGGRTRPSKSKARRRFAFKPAMRALRLLPHEQIPGLVNARQDFTDSPVSDGMRYFFNRGLRQQLRAERSGRSSLRSRKSGLTLDHVNGHLHMHLHPTVFRILMEEAEGFGIKQFRLTRDPFRLNARIASGQWLYRALHAMIYQILSARARPVLERKGIRHTGKVFGLLQNARVDEQYITTLLPLLPEGDSELYSHPSLDEFKNEFDGLISPRVRKQIDTLAIGLIRYQDL